MLLAVPYVEYYIFSLTGHCAIFIIDRFKVNLKKKWFVKLSWCYFKFSQIANCKAGLVWNCYIFHFDFL